MGKDMSNHVSNYTNNDLNKDNPIVSSRRFLNKHRLGKRKYPEQPFMVASLILCCAILATATVSCTRLNMLSPKASVECKTHTWINIEWRDELSDREDSQNPVKLGIMRTSMPESFSHTPSGSSDAGNMFATHIHKRLATSGEFEIVELNTNIDWVGRNTDFAANNSEAINFGRQAGLDWILVSQIEDSGSRNVLVLNVKIIDLHNATTLWSSSTELTKTLPIWSGLIGKQQSSVAYLMYNNQDLVEAANCFCDELLARE